MTDERAAIERDISRLETGIRITQAAADNPRVSPANRATAQIELDRATALLILLRAERDNEPNDG
jgi:hypothetical protein